MVQVPLSTSSMDSGSGFILFADKGTVWAWHGKDVSYLLFFFFLNYVVYFRFQSIMIMMSLDTCFLDSPSAQ